MTKTDRRRSCMYGEMREARTRLHFLNILFRRSDARFERQLSESCRTAGALDQTANAHERNDDEKQ